MRTVRLRPEGAEPIDVTVAPVAGDDEAYTRADGERTVTVDRQRDGAAGWLRVDGRVLPFRVVEADGTVEVWLDGVRTRWTRESRTARRSGDAADTLVGGGIVAPMPGTILVLPAAVGTIVEADDPVVIMESMKMEMTLTAPVRARVDAVHCTTGELVAMHAVLVELTPLDDAG